MNVLIIEMNWSNVTTTILLHCFVVSILLNWSLVSSCDQLPGANIMTIPYSFSDVQDLSLASAKKTEYLATSRSSFTLHAIDRLLSFYWWRSILKILGFPILNANPGFRAVERDSTTWPLSCYNLYTASKPIYGFIWSAMFASKVLKTCQKKLFSSIFYIATIWVG